MRAIRVEETSGPDGVRPAEVDEPQGDLLVDVKAAGISYPDLLLSRGEYQLKPDPPFVLGTEAAGVVRTAPEGSGLSAGDRVALLGFGTFAETVAAQPGGTFKLPDALSFEQGAALVLNYHTAHFALVRRASLREGETLLVHGAAGGVGTAAIQVGRALGANVVAVVSSDAKAEVAREAGADRTVSANGDWRADAGPADVIFDPVGGERFDESVRALAPEGRLIVIGFVEGSIPTVSVNRLLFRNVSVVGAAWGEFALPRPEYLKEVAEDLERMIAGGFVSPIVGRAYDFEDAPQALRDLDERRAIGKLVLRVAAT